MGIDEGLPFGCEEVDGLFVGIDEGMMLGDDEGS